MNQELRNIEEKLENMKSIKLTDNEKHILWSKVEGGIRARRTYGAKQATFMGLSSRFVLTAALIVFVLTSGSFATVAAADNSVPGDRLFPVDIALENLLLRFAGLERRVELRIKFSRERLDEVRIVLAETDFNGSGSSTSTDDGTSTSTDDGTSTSTDDGTSTSTDDGTDDTSTSTDDTSTSTDDTGDGDGDDGDDIDRARNAFTIALDLLEQTKSDLEAEGNVLAALVVQGFIDELTNLAENYVFELEELEVKIKNNGGSLKIKIKASSDELKAKFKFEIDDDGDIEIKLKKKFKDDDDDDRHGRDGEKRNGNGKKVTICHIPPGNSGAAHTITVGKNASLAHFLHGDTLGSCDGDIDDGDEDEDEDDEEAKLTIIKVVVNDDGGSAEVDDFTLFVDDEEVESGDDNKFELGDYVVSEDGPDGYEATFSGDCDENGNVTLDEDDDKTCTITNDDVEVPEEDTTPPVISGLATVAGTSTASITWDTDEDADSKYWQSTSIPVDTSGAPSAETSNLVTSHSLELSGLAASTTYYYVISSTDGAGNTATSAESSFTTL